MSDGRFLIRTDPLPAELHGIFAMAYGDVENHGDYIPDGFLPELGGAFLVKHWQTKWGVYDYPLQSRGGSWIWNANSARCDHNASTYCGGTGEPVSVSLPELQFVPEKDLTLRISATVKCGVKGTSSMATTIYLRKATAYTNGRLSSEGTILEADLTRHKDAGVPDCTMHVNQDSWDVNVRAGTHYRFLFPCYITDNWRGDDSGYTEIVLTWDV